MGVCKSFKLNLDCLEDLAIAEYVSDPARLLFFTQAS